MPTPIGSSTSTLSSADLAALHTYATDKSTGLRQADKSGGWHVTHPPRASGSSSASGLFQRCIGWVDQHWENRQLMAALTKSFQDTVRQEGLKVSALQARNPRAAAEEIAAKVASARRLKFDGKAAAGESTSPPSKSVPSERQASGTPSSAGDTPSPIDTTSRSASSLGARLDDSGSSQEGPRRLRVDGPADEPDQRIQTLPDDAIRHDQKASGQGLPPARVKGISPDTAIQPDPVMDAVRQAVMFNARRVGLNHDATVSLFRKTGFVDSMVRSISQELAAQEVYSAEQITEAALRSAADKAAVTQLALLGYGRPSVDRKG